MGYALAKAFLAVCIGTAVICFLVYGGGFDNAHTETGLKHYAERKSALVKAILPKWIPMPLNTAVNIGYVIVGAYWCAVIFNSQETLEVTKIDAYLFYVFNIMACFYAPIQCIRILTQRPAFAVLDQWATLPFFMWVFIWSRAICEKWNQYTAFIAMVSSISSYVLALYSHVGYEVALGFHICLAVLGAILVYKKYGTKVAHRPFLGAVLSCTCFVVFKLLDLTLASYHPVFKRISGHFLSKIADIFQIHFVNKYFVAILKQKLLSEEKKAN